MDLIDDYIVEAGRLIVEKNKASVGMIQRTFKIGFNRSQRIMDILEDMGVVGAEEGTKPRKVLVTKDEYENIVENYHPKAEVTINKKSPIDKEAVTTELTFSQKRTALHTPYNVNAIPLT